MEKIAFCPDGGEAVEFYVLEQTRLAGRDYILVTESLDEEEGEALILKDVSLPEDAEAVYEAVEDEQELDAVASVFADMLEDVDLERWRPPAHDIGKKQAVPERGTFLLFIKNIWRRTGAAQAAAAGPKRAGQNGISTDRGRYVRRAVWGQKPPAASG